MKTEQSKRVIRWRILGAVGGILMAAGDWLLGCIPLAPTDTGMFNRAILPMYLPMALLIGDPFCDAAYRETPLSQMDAHIPSCYMESPACCHSGYCAGHADTGCHMDVCYEPEQHEQCNRDLVHCGRNLREKAHAR